MDRRMFIGLGGAAALSLKTRGLRAGEDILNLTAAPASVQIGDEEMGETALWLYNGAAPGPVLRIRQGEIFRARFRNRLEQPGTIHWHGLRINNAMDGVAGLTQPGVPPGEDFLYEFTPPDAGSYWYHPHSRSWEQMARGLYGALIIEEAEPPKVDRDLPLLVDDWRLLESGALDEESFGAMMDWSHAGRLGNWPTINGVFQPDIPVKRHERLRLRLMNTANATIMPLRLDGFEGVIVAYDGQPLPEPEKLEGVLRLGPGQRVDVIADVTAEDAAALIWTNGSNDYPFASFPVDGRARDAPMGEIAPLPANPLPEMLDLEHAQITPLRMEGGAMGGNIQARIGRHEMTAHMGAPGRGETPGGVLGLRDLAQEGFLWSFNGVTGMPEQPLFEAKLGETRVIEMINDTSWDHAMHLHGHHFRLVTGDKAGPWRDTLLVAPGETARIAYLADNPGKWMLHCHMLEHQAAGMGTWFTVG